MGYSNITLFEKRNQALKKARVDAISAVSNQSKKEYATPKKEGDNYASETWLNRPLPVVYRYILGIVLALFLFCWGVIFYKKQENVEKRHLKREQLKIQREMEHLAREEREQTAKLEKEHELQKKELDRKKEKEEQMAEYQQLRKEIEAMPKYENWKRAVFKKNGAMCEMCGETKNLEIHHRQSFYSIIKAYSIKNTVQAFENNILWDIDKGSVLCKSCHDKTTSSKYQNNIKTNDYKIYINN